MYKNINNTYKWYILSLGYNVKILNNIVVEVSFPYDII